MLGLKLFTILKMYCHHRYRQYFFYKYLCSLYRSIVRYLIRSTNIHVFQGVVIADLDSKNGISAVEKINSSYGNKRAVFIETDVTKANQLEGMFISLLNYFNYEAVSEWYCTLKSNGNLFCIHNPKIFNSWNFDTSYVVH